MLFLWLYTFLLATRDKNQLKYNNWFDKYVVWNAADITIYIEENICNMIVVDVNTGWIRCVCWKKIRFLYILIMGEGGATGVSEFNSQSYDIISFL